MMSLNIRIIFVLLSCFFLIILTCDFVLAINPNYLIIIKRNPFDPKRGEGIESFDTNGGVISENELEEKYVVYGVLVVDNKKTAYLKELKNMQDKSFRKVAVGDLVDGWKVKEINDNGVLFEKNGKRIFLAVFDNKKKERQSKKPVAFATPGIVLDKPIKKVDSNNKKPVSKKQGLKTQPKVFKFPQNIEEQSEQNPFLKAIIDAQKKKPIN